MASKMTYTTNDIIEMIDSGEFDRADVFMTPPEETGNGSAEDSGDEEITAGKIKLFKSV